jgi:hypothetical protein
MEVKLRTFKFLKILGLGVLIVFLAGFLLSAGAATKEEIAKAQNDQDMYAKVLSDQDNPRPPMLLNHGGPDGGGYYFIDSDDDANNAPNYEWIDISAVGTEINPWPNGTVDDGWTNPIPMGMTFNFYGVDYANIVVSTNGWVSFLTQTNSYLSNAAIPTAANPNAIIAVEWDDLDGGTVGHCYYYYDSANDQFIVSWVNWPYYPDATGPAHDLQVILKSNGDIIAQYGNNAGAWQTDVTVGIENEDGTIGTQIAYNQAYLRSDFAIYYGLTPPIYASHDVRPSAFVAPPDFGGAGDPITPIVTFMNTGSSTESFPVRLIINHSGQVYNQTGNVSNLGPGATSNVTFPAYTPDQEGTYELVAISELATDSIPANDTLRMNYEVYSSIYYQDFEADDGQFVGDNDWLWGPITNPSGPTAHSGVNVWATGLNGRYTIGPLLSTLITPPFGLGSNAILTFWHWYSTESTFDGGNVKVSTDDGATWTLITPNEGYDGVLSTTFGNPIGGEEAFYGASGGWVQATFDLSAFSGTSAIIKFDFGSDSSVDGIGWFVDDFTIIGGGGVEPGWVGGVVNDATTHNPINGAFVSVGSRRDTTDASGAYILQLFPGSYNVTASALYHNDLTINGVVVIEGDTTLQNFELTAPAMHVDTTRIDTSMSLGHTAAFTRTINNTGTGPLNFNVSVNLNGGLRAANVHIDLNSPQGSQSHVNNSDLPSADIAPSREPGDPPSILDFGDEVFFFDPQTPPNDVACLGVEFDGTYFWVTGRHPDDEVHKLHKYDRDGNYIESFNQGTSSVWGWRDLAFDGTYLYASDENQFAQIDPSTGQRISTLPMPSGFTPPLRGLAYDPATDHFWAVNFASNIIEFTRAGQIVNSYFNSLSAYGLAWDDVSEGGPWLWVFSQDGTPPIEVSQFNPRTGMYTGVTFFAIDHGGENNDLAGGCCFTTQWNPSLGILFCLVQGQDAAGNSFDLVQGYEITPASVWLSVSPTSGTIEAGGSANLTITVDFTGANIVPDSTYRGSVQVTGNVQGQAVIHVTARVNPVGIEEQPSDLPREFSLAQNYPNPFNPNTMISFDVPHRAHVELSVYDITGAKVTTLMNSDLDPGTYQVNFAGKDAEGRAISSGVYFYRLKTEDRVLSKKMLFVK